MMIRLRDIRLEIGEEFSVLQRKTAKILHISEKDIVKMKLLKRSVDARKKQDIHYVVTVAVDAGEKTKTLLKKGFEAYEPFSYTIPQVSAAKRPVIVGFGPAGMFCALVLAKAGLCPIVLERGDCAEVRREKVRSFWNGGPLDPESNVQFGEGGAGTFSDGKLNTGTNNPRIAWVLEMFRKFGAQESVTYDAKPHVGTDILIDVVKNLREEVLSLGGTILFNHKFNDYVQTPDGLELTCLCNGEPRKFVTDHLVLALGHSARDTFEMLLKNGMDMQPKSFSVGVRIEHPQKTIDRAQYGKTAGLPPADYKLNCRTKTGSAYTFCMCPGGQVVAAASEENSVVTNGMSYSGRDSMNANAALLVSVTPEDFPDSTPLSGMYWQRSIEQRAFAYTGSYHAPAQLVGDFLKNTSSSAGRKVKPSYQPGVFWGDLRKVLPKKITDTLAEAIPLLGKKLSGFDDPSAVLTGPETRSSSPVRILRGEDRMSVNIPGIYPCGEGAGYAGGITSAAVDGMRTAEAIIKNILQTTGGTPHEFTK